MALDFFAGSVAGAAGVLAGHPLDTVKVRLQTQPEVGEGAGRYRGLFHCLARMVKEEGAASLYKGIAPPLAGLAVVNALIFGVQNATLRALPNQTDPLYHLLAGSVAGCVQSLVTSPMELVKLRLQLQGQGQPNFSTLSTHSNHDIYRGPVHCLRTIFRQGGLVGLCRGLGTTIVRDGPAFGLYFYSYEVMTRRMNPGGSSALSAPQLLFAGGAAGVVSWVATYPVDVVKSRLQADGIYASQRKYNGPIHCLRTTLQTEGYKGMTKGMGSAIARAFVLNAVTFYTVEWVYRMYTRYEKVSVAEKKRYRPVMDICPPWRKHHYHLHPLGEAGTSLLDPCPFLQ